jgi:hypothetical protein
MTELEAPPCPRCGDRGAVVQAATLLAQRGAVSQPAQPVSGFPAQPVSGFPAQPISGCVDHPLQRPPASSRPTPATSYGGGEIPSQEYLDSQLEAGLIMGAVAAVWTFGVWRPLLRPIWRRVSTQAMQRMEEGRAQAAARQRSIVAILERHPDLCSCQRDQVAFLAGQEHTLPAEGGKAACIRG